MQFVDIDIEKTHFPFYKFDNWTIIYEYCFYNFVGKHFLKFRLLGIYTGLLHIEQLALFLKSILYIPNAPKLCNLNQINYSVKTDYQLQ